MLRTFFNLSVKMKIVHRYLLFFKQLKHGLSKFRKIIVIIVTLEIYCIFMQNILFFISYFSKV